MTYMQSCFQLHAPKTTQTRQHYNHMIRDKVNIIVIGIYKLFLRYNIFFTSIIGVMDKVTCSSTLTFNLVSEVYVLSVLCLCIAIGTVVHFESPTFKF